MFFTAGEMQPSHVELLLNRLDAAAASLPAGSAAQAGGSSAEFVDEAPPTLTDFLDEDDLLPECRSENARLIGYLCKQEQILVRWWGRRVGVAAVGSWVVACPRHERCLLCLGAAATACDAIDIVGACVRCERFCVCARASDRTRRFDVAARHGETPCCGDRCLCTGTVSDVLCA